MRRATPACIPVSRARSSSWGRRTWRRWRPDVTRSTRDRIHVSVDHKDGRGEDGARLEAHRRYIDIQYPIDGDELIGWMPLAPGAPRLTAGFDEKEGRRLLRRSSVDVGVGAARQLHHLLSARRPRAARRPWPPEEGDREDRAGTVDVFFSRHRIPIGVLRSPGSPSFWFRLKAQQPNACDVSGILGFGSGTGMDGALQHRVDVVEPFV